MTSPPVQVGDILLGTIARIETYGAFCALQQAQHHHRQLQGLIHISQLADMRVEKVEDVVSVNDEVWVKVLQVEQQQPEDERRPAKWRIRLSMKDAAQDGTRVDLGKQREEREDAKDRLEMNLNSMIGMGVARDPMADNNRLIMKNTMGSSNTSATTFRGGYSLVGDDEGEPEAVAPVVPEESSRLPPVGRGRGATLPAWMTSETNKGPTGLKDDENASDAGRKKKSHKKRSKSSHKKKHSKHHSKTKDRKRRHRRRRSRSRSRDSRDSRFDDDDREPKRSHRKRRRRSPSQESSSGSRSDDRDFEEKSHHRRRARSRSHDSNSSATDDRDETKHRRSRSRSGSRADIETKGSKRRRRRYSRSRSRDTTDDEDDQQKDRRKHRTRRSRS